MSSSFSALVLLTAMMAAAWMFTSSDSPMKDRAPASMKVIPLGQGEPWYGGKPSIPVIVESDVEGTVPAEEWIPIRVSILSEMECRSIATRIRGIDAVEVSASEQEAPCAGGPILHEARIRVPSGGEGIAAVDIEVRTASGTRVTTKALAFNAALREASTSQ